MTEGAKKTATPDRPLQGGTYTRHKDGSLERIGGTANDPKPAPVSAPETVAVAETPIAVGDGADTPTKKGK